MNFYKIDNFHEISEDMYKIMNILDASRDKENNICKNVSLQTFQEKIRKEYESSDNAIKLIGIDVSRTIIEYTTNEITKNKAAFLLKQKYPYFKSLTIRDIVGMFDVGFNNYHRNRKKTCIEEDELFVYKKFIFNKIKNISDDDLTDIIRIWKEHSVKITLNSKKIRNIVNKLKKRGYIVITISDMLGDMSKYALKKMQVYDLFDAHFCSNDFKFRKSNLKNSLYQIIQKHYSLKPHNCLMIGNDYYDDIECSTKNGWKAVYIKYYNDFNLTDKQNIIFTIDELDDLIRKCESNENCKKLFENKITNLFNGKSNRDNDENIYICNAYYLRQKSKFIANRELREKIYKKYFINECGIETRLGNNIEIRNPYNLYIGNNCQINDNITILNDAPVLIGNNVMIAVNVFISTYYHNWRKGMIQDNVQSWNKGDTKNYIVSIEDNCWLGPNVVVEANTIIGHHSVICANTIVKSGIYPPYSLIGGNPGKIIKNIEGELIIERKIFNYE